MKKGYYDLLLNSTTEIKDDYLVKTLQQEIKKIPDLDQYLTKQFEQKLIQHLSEIQKTEDKLEFLNQLLTNFTDQQFSQNILLQIPENKQAINYQSQIRLVDNYLFTNNQEQNLIEQLNQEIITSNQVDLIYPFISKAMINKLRLAFNYTKEHQIPINLITTTFDDQALYVNLFELEQLIKNYPNITIRIEDNTELRSERIHIKAAIFHRESGFSSTILGSSNLTMPGMVTGREWNIRINQFTNKKIYDKIVYEYNTIWNDNLLEFNDEKIRKALLQRILANQSDSQLNKTNYSLYKFQKDILETLTYRRKINKHQHLIVMATGTGKTVISAFDYLNQIQSNFGQKPKVLFLAHQKEIVEQGLQTFRQVLNESNFGSLLNISAKNFNSQYLFATIQSVHRHLKKFQPNQFDLIIFDEAHHIAANTFNQVFNYFQPQEIIGLTATPEREDNKSILPYFNNEFAYELRLWDAIEQKLLAKFDYYCIDDVNSNLIGIDLNNDQQIFKILNNDTRNQLLLKMIKNYIGIYHQPLALVFCINVQHAQIISDFLNSEGLKADYLTSKNNYQRKQILQNFKNHKINYLCVVNMFNEGIDVPEIDTIILLRPTNSKTVFLQQLGRGLRKTINKNKLQVYDLIANIDQKYDITVGIKTLYHNQATLNHKEIFNQGFSLPDGCTINLETRSREIILKNLQSWYHVPKRMHQVIHEYYSKYQLEGLEKIINDYDLTLPLFYEYLDDFYLRVAWQFQPLDNQQNQTQRNKNILKQFLFLNNYQIVYYFYHRLANDLTKIKINPIFDNLLIISLFPEVTSIKVYQSRFINYGDDLVFEFIKNHQLIVKELLMILKYKLENEVLQINQSEIKNYPLLIKGTTYTVRQALASINRLNFLKSLGELKVIAFQAGYLTFDETKSVVLADVDGQKYGKLTNYDWTTQEFYWSIPENKDAKSKLVRDLQTPDITKFLFLDNKINKNYANLSLKLYDFIGIGNYLKTINDHYLTIKFQVEE